LQIKSPKCPLQLTHEQQKADGHSGSEGLVSKRHAQVLSIASKVHFIGEGRMLGRNGKKAQNSLAANALGIMGIRL